MEIKIIDIKKVEHHGSLKGLMVVQIPPFLVYGIKVIHEPGKDPWVGMPQSKGGDKYYRIIEFVDRIEEINFQKFIVTEWNKYLAQRGDT